METFKMIMMMLLGATGAWKIVEVLVQTFAKKREVNANSFNLEEEARKKLFGSLLSWFDKQEEKVEQLEKLTEKQGLKIKDLEARTKDLEKENQAIKLKIEIKTSEIKEANRIISFMQGEMEKLEHKFNALLDQNQKLKKAS